MIFNLRRDQIFNFIYMVKKSTFLVLFISLISISSYSHTRDFLTKNNFLSNNHQSQADKASSNTNKFCANSISNTNGAQAKPQLANPGWFNSDPIIQEALHLSRSIIIPKIIQNGFNKTFSYSTRFYKTESKKFDIESIINEKQSLPFNSENQYNIAFLEIILKIHEFLNNPAQVLPLLVALENELIIKNLTNKNLEHDYLSRLQNYLYHNEEKSNANTFYDALSVDHKEDFYAFRSLIYLFGAKNNFSHSNNGMLSLVDVMSETILKHFGQDISINIPTIKPKDVSSDLSGKISMQILKDEYLKNGVFLDYGLTSQGSNTHGVYTHLIQAYLTAKFLDQNQIRFMQKPVLGKDIYAFLSRPNITFKILADQYYQDPWVYIYDVISREGQYTFFYRTFGCPEFIYYFINELPIFPFLNIE